MIRRPPRSPLFPSPTLFRSLVDAGAGTGKTSLVVERFVDMVAPTAGGPPVPIERLAAITFTRKAAGDLRLRIRERLRSEEHTSELQSRLHLVCRLLLEKKKR